ncbi:MAG: hypothetical protein IT306_10520 [Chloroflexi bacterium]|nr:hypothetical protein [Chloroflexota bacterium]
MRRAAAHRCVGRGRRAAVSRHVDLRAAVLRAGKRLGWDEREVVAFAEALVGRPWRRCCRTSLETVLGEYVALAQIIRAKAARRARRMNGAEGTYA